MQIIASLKNNLKNLENIEFQKHKNKEIYFHYNVSQYYIISLVEINPETHELENIIFETYIYYTSFKVEITPKKIVFFNIFGDKLLEYNIEYLEQNNIEFRIC